MGSTVNGFDLVGGWLCDLPRVKRYVGGAFDGHRNAVEEFSADQTGCMLGIVLEDCR